MSKATILVTVALAGAAFGCARAAEDAVEKAPVSEVAVTPELVREGRTVYRKYCTQCHGYSGKGDGTSAANLDPPPRDHTNAEIMNAIDDRTVAETVRFGGMDRGFRNMPAFPQLPDGELLAIVAYVRSLSRPGVASIDIGELD